MKYNWCDKSRESMILVLSTIFVIDFLTIFVATKSTVVVKTTFGPVQGEILTTVNSVEYAAFKGIRYAKPPIGYLRFKPPVAVDRWTETLNATVEGDDCIQIDSMTNVLKGSEDCLFINVFTPVTNLQSTPAKLKSVMVWIYGGAFLRGSSSSEMYKPDFIIEKDVVYVSLNYRLGAMGFLSLNHANATGNAGLKDQTLGLKWVRANIEKFGGNPKNVTIFGESAGSASVGYHVLSDASTGLFHGAISMSGVPLNPWAFQTREEALLLALKLGSVLGTITINKATLLRALYRASAAEIVNATNQISKYISPFLPTLEDKNIATDVFLSKCSVTKYNTGNYNKVPQLIGFMDEETVSFFFALEPMVSKITYAIDVAKRIGMALPPGLKSAQFLIEQGINILEVLTNVTISKIINETTDLLFVAQIDQTQKFLAANNVAPVYYYDVTFYSNQSLHNVQMKNTFEGPGHGDDLGYIFYFPETNYSTDPTDPVTRTIHRFSTMWTNFAKYGNPTPDWININDDLNVTWPDSGRSGIGLDIGTELSVVPRPVRSEVKLIQTLSLPFLGTFNGCNRILP